MDSKINYRLFLAGACVSTIFGFTFLFTKEALDVLEPFHLLGFRFALAALIFLIMQLCGIVKINLKGKDLGKLAVLTLMEPVIYFVCETIGVSMTTSSEAAIVVSLVPVITTIFAAIYLKEKPTGLQAGFIFLSVSGVILMTVMKGSIQVAGNILGTFILIGSAISAGIYNVLSRKLSPEFFPVEITYSMTIVGAIVFNGISVAQHLIRGDLRSYFYPLINVKVLTSIVFLGAFASIIAFFMLNYLLSEMEASRVSVISNVATVISVIAGSVFRNEPIYWFNIVGGIMILAGVWGTNHYGRKDDLAEAHKTNYTSKTSRKSEAEA